MRYECNINILLDEKAQKSCEMNCIAEPLLIHNEKLFWRRAPIPTRHIFSCTIGIPDGHCRLRGHQFKADIKRIPRVRPLFAAK